jgi:hypothetical protein
MVFAHSMFMVSRGFKTNLEKSKVTLKKKIHRTHSMSSSFKKVNKQAKTEAKSDAKDGAKDGAKRGKKKK